MILKDSKSDYKKFYNYLEESSIKCKRNFGSIPTQHKAFEDLEPGMEVTVEIRKSRFQVQDLFILSIGVLVGEEAVTLPENTVNIEQMPIKTEVKA